MHIDAFDEWARQVSRMHTTISSSRAASGGGARALEQWRVAARLTKLFDAFGRRQAGGASLAVRRWRELHAIRAMTASILVASYGPLWRRRCVAALRWWRDTSHAARDERAAALRMRALCCFAPLRTAAARPAISRAAALPLAPRAGAAGRRRCCASGMRRPRRSACAAPSRRPHTPTLHLAWRDLRSNVSEGHAAYAATCRLAAVAAPRGDRRRAQRALGCWRECAAAWGGKVWSSQMLARVTVEGARLIRGRRAASTRVRGSPPPRPPPTGPLPTLLLVAVVAERRRRLRWPPRRRCQGGSSVRAVARVPWRRRRRRRQRVQRVRRRRRPSSATDDEYGTLAPSSCATPATAAATATTAERLSELRELRELLTPTSRRRATAPRMHLGQPLARVSSHEVSWSGHTRAAWRHWRRSAVVLSPYLQFEGACRAAHPGGRVILLGKWAAFAAARREWRELSAVAVGCGSFAHAAKAQRAALARWCSHTALRCRRIVGRARRRGALRVCWRLGAAGGALDRAARPPVQPARRVPAHGARALAQRGRGRAHLRSRAPGRCRAVGDVGGGPRL